MRNIIVPGEAETSATLGDTKAETPPPQKTTLPVFLQTKGGAAPENLSGTLVHPQTAETPVHLGDSRAESPALTILAQACPHTDKGRNLSGSSGAEVYSDSPGRRLRLTLDH